jgi:hypothetical protein
MYSYMPRGWFVYNPGSTSNDPADRGNYKYIGKPFECSGNGIICTVYAYYTSGTPLLGITSPAPFSSRITGYLNAAAASSVPLPAGSSEKKYVYLKNS